MTSAHSEELSQLIEDAAKLLGIRYIKPSDDYDGRQGLVPCNEHGWPCGRDFNPLDPERGDLMKVAMAAELDLDFECCEILYPTSYSIVYEPQKFTKGDHDSLVLAILRAASAVLKARES